MLKVRDLRVRSDGDEILHDLNFEAEEGGLYVIMGPNGSGKSTFSKTLAGHPDYENYEGSIRLKGEEAEELTPGERLKKGLMLGFQHPPKIEGVKIERFLETVLKNRNGYKDPESRKEAIMKAADSVGFDGEELGRGINDGFSGGERKRLELMQARLISPDLLILDEPDSGIDVDSLKLIAEQINYLRNRDTAIVLITHYGDTLNDLNLAGAEVHLFKDGRIVTSGDAGLAEEVEKKGFNEIYEECGCD
ncbi:MAG: Fe-S cluster assembly ATPase SufC [Candidatus Bipolaricaulota bacterium]